MSNIGKSLVGKFRSLPKWWATPFVGIAGGYVAQWCNFPLPWMIGSMLAVALARCLTPWQIAAIPHGRSAGQFVTGLGIGMYIDDAVMAHFFNHLGLMVLGAVLTALSSLILMALLRWAGEDRATAYFSSMPGGSTEMVNLASRNGAQVDSVVAAQTLRLTIVVLCAPALVQSLFPMTEGVIRSLTVDWPWMAFLVPVGLLVAWLWQRLRQPNPWLLGPIFVSAVVCVGMDVQVGFPQSIRHLAQVFIGAGLGALLSREFFLRAHGFILRTLIGTGILMAVAVGLAMVFSYMSALNLPSTMLGMMPGGIAEMSLTAEALNLSAPMVVAMQMLRVILVLFCAEPMYRLWGRLRGSGKAAG